jgi:hypothetical protein
MEPSKWSLSYYTMRLRVIQLRYELGCLASLTGMGTPVVVIVAGMLSCMIAVLSGIIAGTLSPFGMLLGGGLGFVLGSSTACLLIPVFDTVDAETFVAARARVIEIGAALAEERKRIEEYQAAEERRAAYDRRAAIAATAEKMKPQEATSQTRGWGAGAVCWYCSQRLNPRSIQCCYCRMINRTSAA